MKTKIFFDTEFTGLRQNTTLISIGLVSETGKKFYGELTDYDESQVSNFVQEHVISHLSLRELAVGEETLVDYSNHPERVSVKGNSSAMAHELSRWLLEFGEVQMWADHLAYDWVLFCELFGGARQLPDHINYIPLDLPTAFEMKKIDPDIGREGFVGMGIDAKKHDALWDAEVLKACYEKLMNVGKGLS
ncbi:MAG: 3'-5' exoribonuclease [Gammaproteobacteria bacterium]